MRFPHIRPIQFFFYFTGLGNEDKNNNPCYASANERTNEQMNECQCDSLNMQNEKKVSATKFEINPVRKRTDGFCIL